MSAAAAMAHRGLLPPSGRPSQKRNQALRQYRPLLRCHQGKTLNSERGGVIEYLTLTAVKPWYARMASWPMLHEKYWQSSVVD